MKQHTITLKGKEIKSIYGEIAEQQLLNEVRDNFYNEDKEKAIKQLKGVLLDNKVMINHINEYYFKRIAYDTICEGSLFSVNEVLENDMALSILINLAKNKPKLCDPKKGLVSGVKTLMRLGSMKLCRIPSNFSLKSAKELLNKYKNKGVYLDPCCGWGVRMIAAAALDMEYIGFDVNAPLIEKLNELGKDIQTIKPNFKFKIYKQGSQYEVKDLENKADIVLTSPPYFNLEDYNHREIEENDTITNKSYDEWLNEFVNPMLKNCYNYLKKCSYCLMNVKDFNGLTLEDDFKEIGKKIGFEFIGYDDYKLVKRVGNTEKNKNKMSGKEKVIVLYKK